MTEHQPIPRPSHARLVRAVGSDGMEFAAARTLEEVAAAWGLAYRAYRRVGLIEPNPHRLYAPPQVACPRAAVFFGRIGPLLVSTVTALVDDGSPLPMQSPFDPQIQRLRQQGCKLIEAVLFADRREQLERVSHSLLELVRLVYYYGRWSGCSDVVASVQPADVAFFERLFAFEALGEAQPCPHQLHRPAVPMRCNLDALARHLTRHPALQQVLGAPVSDQVFASRYAFDEQSLSRHVVGEYVAQHRQQRAIRQVG